MSRIAVVFVTAVLAVCSCNSGSDDMARRTLEVILKDDLKSVLEEIPPSSRRDSSYYVIREYETYERSRYTVRAVVDFHFLKGDVAKIVRKYRYYDRFGQWERYYNQYHFVDTSAGGGDDR